MTGDRGATLNNMANLTDLRHRQSHSHCHTDKERRQEDLREEALCIPLCTVEPLGD